MATVDGSEQGQPSLANPSVAGPSAMSLGSPAPTEPLGALNLAQQPVLTDYSAIIQQAAAAVARELALAFCQSKPIPSSSSACPQVPVRACFCSAKDQWRIAHAGDLFSVSFPENFCYEIVRRLAMLFLPWTTQQLRVLRSQFITERRSSADIVDPILQALVPVRML